MKDADMIGVTVEFDIGDEDAVALATVREVVTQVCAAAPVRDSAFGRAFVRVGADLIRDNQGPEEAAGYLRGQLLGVEP